MAISIDWGQKIINVPKADLQLVQSNPIEIRQLDLDIFRRTLNDLQDEVQGITYDTTHRHVAPITVGGVTLARVVEIINGYTVTFEDGQYAVNLVGANSNVGDVVNLNQVSVRSANSAGLTFSDQINQQSYAGSVWVDTVDGLPGQIFPRGTPTDPVDNWGDAAAIATTLNLKSFQITSSLVFPVAEDLEGHLINGVNALNSVVLIQGGITRNTSFKNLTLAGDFGTGYCLVKESNMGALTNFEGTLFNCIVNGNIQLSTTPDDISKDVSFMNCVSGYPGDVSFTLDCNSTTSSIQFRNWSGGVTIDNFTSGSSFMSIDLSQGKVTINPTCTGGEILVRGEGLVIDNSGVGCTVLDYTTNRRDTIINEGVQNSSLLIPHSKNLTP